MENLKAPSRDVALQLLDEVDFKDRLMASTLHTRAGVRIVSLYSLEEVFLLLKEPYPQIDPAQLENWIRTVIQDGELADRIKTVSREKAENQNILHAIRDLIGWRLIQCRQATG